MPLILFGTDQKVRTDRVFDLIILLAKFHNYKLKLQKKNTIFEIFKQLLNQRAKVERYGSVDDAEWTPYTPVLSFHI